MSKKKKGKKKKSISILQEVDKNLNGTYDNILEEIQDLQIRLNIADQKARRKAKKIGKRGTDYYNFNRLRKEAREQVVADMEGKNILDRIMNLFKDIIPIVVVIGRLVASLIVAILSVDAVKINIKPATLEKMTAVYNKAMALQ